MEKNTKQISKFISYKDDDDSVKSRWVIVINENDFGMEFTFEDSVTNITIPWNRILKIKTKEVEE